GQHLNQSAREAIAENLMLEPIMGKRLNVMDEAHLRRVHHVQPLAHDRLKHQVLSDGFAGRLVEVLADGVDTP
ncbi:hypothetical protein, partial [Aeromonas caviae]|uniref:hypothetical protein n=1 Tax=Aeromonas caviae TaxID=648 RepID=UPI0040392C9A